MFLLTGVFQKTFSFKNRAQIITGVLVTSSLSSIRSEVCLVTMETETENQSVFVDLDFPADGSSVFCDYTTPLSKLLADVTWLRPQVTLFHIGDIIYYKQTNIFPMSKDEDFI